MTLPCLRYVSRTTYTLRPPLVFIRALCPLLYSRLYPPFIRVICVIRDSDKLPTPFALLSLFIRLSKSLEKMA